MINNKIGFIKRIFILALIFKILIAIIPKNYIEINFIDVGQGDCTLIKSDSGNILIDGGGSENSNYDVGNNILIPYLLDNTNGVIDILFISHFHEDHAEGCIAILEKLVIKKIIIGPQPKSSNLYNEMLKLAKAKSIPIFILSKGDNISLGNVEFSILYPEKDLEISSDFNNNSLVIKMKYYNTSVLFTGDIEQEAEQLLIEETLKGECDLNVDILKVAHHGSKTSNTESFIEEVTPVIALIGVGADNKFNHPNEEILKRLENIKSFIYRTDECGEIYMKIFKDGKISVNSVLNKK